jgi:hypothetical protein
VPPDVKDLIERDLKAALSEAGMLPEAIDLALPAIRRDRITCDNDKREVKGVKEAVDAFKAERPALFGDKMSYRDTTKSLVDIERARDMECFGQRAADLY